MRRVEFSGALLKATMTPLIIASSIAFSGCATTGTPRVEKYPGVSTSAPGVAASVNFAQPVMAPCRIKLPDGARQEILIEVPGYRPFQAGVKRTPARWGWKGMNFGDRITIAVDVSGGGVYFLSREQYLESFRREAVRRETTADYLHVVAVQTADREWRQIASLRRHG